MPDPEKLKSENAEATPTGSPAPKAAKVDGGLAASVKAARAARSGVKAPAKAPPAKKAPTGSPAPKAAKAAPPADDVGGKAPPVLEREELQRGTPQFEARQAAIREKADRKKNTKIIDEWIEFSPDKNNKKGGKVIRAVKNNRGNVHRSLLGFSSKLENVLKEAKASGKLRPRW